MKRLLPLLLVLLAILSVFLSKHYAVVVPPDESGTASTAEPSTEPSENAELQDIAAYYAAQVTDDYSLTLPDGTTLRLCAPYAPLADCTREYFFDGDGMTVNDYLRHAREDYSLIVGTAYYSAERAEAIRQYWSDFGPSWSYTYEGKADEEFIDYLCTNVVGAKTDRGVAVGDGESAVLTAYPEKLLYISNGTEVWNAGSGEDGDYNEPPIVFDYALAWRPYENNDCRDITFYIKDGRVVTIEIISPYELRYVYGFDNEESDRVIAEKRAALG